MIIESKTFRELTAPGYFNFSSSQKPKTKQISDWFNGLYDYEVEQTNLFDDIFRLWATRDYSSLTINRTPYVKFLLSQYGIDWFSGSDNQAVGLLSILNGGFSNKAIENFQNILSDFVASPFFWITGTPSIVFGMQVPSYLAEILIIYSTSPTPPLTPSPIAYIERDWEAPVGWTLFPSESTYVSRGYLVGSDIVWADPISTSIEPTFYMVEDIAGLPVSPDEGDIALVNNDGSGDTVSTYFYDGTDWRKNNTPYLNQGNLDDGIPSTPIQRVVAAPDSSTFPISSEIKPPIAGLSKGYGIYGGLSGSIISANVIYLYIILTADGFANLGVIINFLRRIKPTVNRLIVYYTIQGSLDPVVEQEIFDSGALY